MAHSSEATDSNFCLDEDELRNSDHDDISIDDYSMNAPCNSPDVDETDLQLVTSSSESEMPFSDNEIGTFQILRAMRIKRKAV